MVTRGLRILGPALAFLFVGTAATAHAEPGTPVYPGMEIRQDTNRCTIGFVDVETRTAISAGHCHASGPVTDRHGTLIGQQAMFRDNTPNGATISTDHLITDWETIALLPEVEVNNVLPGGRVLVVDSAVVPVAGQAVCHFGVVTGESCGSVEAVMNGWFTMTNGVVSQKGDSGGPVYVPTNDNRAIIVGIFNSTWGQFPAAVSWQSTDQQMREGVLQSASGTTDPLPAPAG